MVIWKWMKLYDAMKTATQNEREAKFHAQRILRAKVYIDQKLGYEEEINKEGERNVEA